MQGGVRESEHESGADDPEACSAGTKAWTPMIRMEYHF